MNTTEINAYLILAAQSIFFEMYEQIAADVLIISIQSLWGVNTKLTQLRL